MEQSTRATRIIVAIAIYEVANQGSEADLTHEIVEANQEGTVVVAGVGMRKKCNLMSKCIGVGDAAREATMHVSVMRHLKQSLSSESEWIANVIITATMSATKSKALIANFQTIMQIKGNK